MSPQLSIHSYIKESERSPLNTLAIEDLRARILQDKCCRKCTPEDLQRLKTQDWWLTCFLRAYNYDLDISYTVLSQCIQWRTNFQVERISILGMKPLLDRGLAYLHGRDLTECSILWINLAQYRPGDTGFENLFIFWLERHTMDTKADPLTIVVDMTGTSMKNMDMNSFKFILHAAKYYYPNTVHDMVIFESPPIFNATWRVIESWLTPGHPQIHHVDKETIAHFIDSKYLPRHMGGEDHFQFSMDELAKCLPPPNPPENNHMNLDDADRSPERNGIDSVAMRRAVTFDDDDEEANRKTPLTLTRKVSNGSVKRGIPQNLKPMVEARMRSPDIEWIKNAFLHISPRDILTLNRLENNTDYVDVVAVRNVSQSPVMFKIKTTSPEKFRVRPSTGLIPAGTTDIIRVYLQNEYRNSCSREKFLLMALETESNNMEMFGDLWKNAEHSKKVEQKLRCRIADDASSEGSNTEKIGRKTSISSQQEQIDRLRLHCEWLQRSQRMLMFATLTLFFALVVLLLYEKSNHAALETAVETLIKKLDVTATCESHSDSKRETLPPVSYEEDL
uniref:Major sperm protein n=1 Tax=Haemonchus contortus TaxID=6289 RepID=A0A7I4YC42_HAECO